LGKFEPQKLPNEYALAVHELVQAKIEQRAPEVEIETEKRDRVGASTVLHFGNVNYRHMPRTRLTFGTGSEVLSGCRNQPTVPADGDPACVPAGRVSFDCLTPLQQERSARRTLNRGTLDPIAGLSEK